MKNWLSVVWLLPTILVKLDKKNLTMGCGVITGISGVNYLHMSSQTKQRTSLEANTQQLAIHWSAQGFHLATCEVEI